MTTEHEHNDQGRPEGDNTIEAKRPYWTRAHHDWRFWVVLILMVAAMVIYIASQGLSMAPHGQPRQPVPENTVAP